MTRVDNAIIMAAGTSSRFAPLSHEIPKGLISVHGEVLLERQIKQLHEVGINEIIVVTGYKHECFDYLADSFGVTLVHNNEFELRNNNSSIWVAKEHLKNSYVCSSDNFFSENPFEDEVDGAYYASVYSEGPTDEWCLTVDADGCIDSVTIGGCDAWYMLGHTFWDETFSKTFIEILKREYDAPETSGKLWEQIFAEHLDELKMKMKKYPASSIFEFDTLDELRLFDSSYIDNTRSEILKIISKKINCCERDITRIIPLKDDGNTSTGIEFYAGDRKYKYMYDREELIQL